MKRYMVFAGEEYYSSGGATNLLGTADTLEEAWEMVGPSSFKDRENGKYDWCHAYDTQEDKIIARPNWGGETHLEGHARGHGTGVRYPEGEDEWSDY
jgi:hypothetical protein